MKHTYNVVILIVGLIALSVSSVSAQTPTLFGEEPALDLLGAPMYPGAVFVRLLGDLNPDLETAMYISMVPFELIEDFYNRQLAEKRSVTYEDSETFLTAYLLRTWSDFPSVPDRDDIYRLRQEPSVVIEYYNPGEFHALTSFYETQTGGRRKVETIRNGKTKILFTYPKAEDNTYSRMIIGSWRETSRDLPDYYGSVITFRKDGTYTYQATPENIAAMASHPLSGSKYADMELAERLAAMTACNPENGTYSVMGNNIAMKTDASLDGIDRKSGLAEAGRMSLKLELIDKPRLTFIKSRSNIDPAARQPQRLIQPQPVPRR